MDDMANMAATSTTVKKQTLGGIVSKGEFHFHQIAHDHNQPLIDKQSQQNPSPSAVKHMIIVSETKMERIFFSSHAQCQVSTELACAISA